MTQVLVVRSLRLWLFNDLVELPHNNKPNKSQLYSAEQAI